MKKRLSVFFVLSLLLGCAGCGGAVPDSSALPYESTVQSGQTEESADVQSSEQESSASSEHVYDVQTGRQLSLSEIRYDYADSDIQALIVIVNGREYRQDIFAFDAECYFVKCQDAGYLYLFPRREMSIMLCLRMTICSGRTRIQSFRRMYCTLLNWTRRKAV